MKDLASRGATRPLPVVQRVASDHRFFMAMALAALAVVLAGFATSYYLWPITHATHLANGLPIPATFPLIVHVHGVAFSAWMLLFVAQVRLVALGRTDVHRRIGLAAAWLVPILVGTGVMTAIQGTRNGRTPFGADPLSFMIVPFGDIVVFTALVTAGPRVVSPSA